MKKITYGFILLFLLPALFYLSNCKKSKNPPAANFSADKVVITAGQSVNFIDLSTNNPTKWAWSFPGGTPATSTLQNPKNIVYNTPGLYTVVLTATNGDGSNTSTKTDFIQVDGLPPVANFTCDEPTIGENGSVHFTDLSTNTPTTWSWTFTGGTPSTGNINNPVITYSTVGDFLVKLKVSNAYGSDSMTKLSYIHVTKGQACAGVPFVRYMGRTYHTLQLDLQCWMKENLNAGTFVSSVTTTSTHSDVSDNGIIEKYCGSNDTNNCNIYGALYDWNELMNYVTTAGAQGICPTGWHIPTDQDFATLETFLGMSSSDLNRTGWGGTDEGTKLLPGGSTGFNAGLGGYRNHLGDFYTGGTVGYFWSSTDSPSLYPWTRVITTAQGGIWRTGFTKAMGFSVRCIKN